VKRRLAFAAFAVILVLLTGPVLARSVTDSAGRQVTIPDQVARVIAAGPPAATLLYVLAPEKMVGWVSPPSADDKPYLLPQTTGLPVTGRLTGRGDTLNLDKLVAAKPDLVIDFGTVNDSYRALAERVQTQTGIPYLLIDGRLETISAALRLLGDVLGVQPRGDALAQAADAILAEVDRTLAAVPADKRPHVYLARGPEGLETGPRGSINTEIIERAGGINVVDPSAGRGGIVTLSLEKLMALAPDTIVTLDSGFAAHVRTDAAWQKIPAVADGRVYLAPSHPFGFLDSPPSVNRLIGLVWLLHTLYPAQASGNLAAQVKDFYHLFYQVDLTDTALAALLKGS
jgi:iron complex transport system substrate-binding protein